MPYRRYLVALAIVLGIALVAIAAIYFAEPAGSLPWHLHFLGYDKGSSHHHVKHGIAALLVGVAFFAFAWFNTGPKKSRSA